MVYTGRFKREICPATSFNNLAELLGGARIKGFWRKGRLLCRNLSNTYFALLNVSGKQIQRPSGDQISAILPLASSASSLAVGSASRRTPRWVPGSCRRLPQTAWSSARDLALRFLQGQRWPGDFMLPSENLVSWRPRKSASTSVEREGTF